MKKSLLLAGILAAAAAVQAENDKVFVLAPAGGTDPALVENVRAYLMEYADVEIRLAPAVAPAETPDLDALGRAAAQALAAADYAVVVLARAGAAQPLDVCPPDARYAVLNLDRLEAAPGAGLERRAGQMTLRLMARRLGMTPCPFPLCLLVSFDSVAELDRMSGNCCPPCRDRFNRLARAAGLALTGLAAETPPAPAAGE